MTPLSSSISRARRKGDSPRAIGWFSDVRPREALVLNVLATVLLLLLAAAPLAVLGGWLAGRRNPQLGSLVRAGGSDAWWRETMPWPTGVQEEDDVHWNFGPAETAGDRSPDEV